MAVGNVATYEAAKAMTLEGAACVKVGIGSGSICTTRVVSGVGMPQWSAVQQCALAVRDHQTEHVGVVADGGLR